MKMVADKCNRCGKAVIKHGSEESSDMVETHDSFLYLCDLKKDEGSRPTLQLREGGRDQNQLYCLDCLVSQVSEWVEKMKARGASKIPLNHIIFGDKVPSPCPLCGK